MDEEVKAAAGGVTSKEQQIPIECPGILPWSRAAELQRFKKESKRGAKEFFAKSPKAENALNIDLSMPSAAFAKLISKLMRRHTSLLVQLHTGHIVLNKHLSKIGKATTPTCTACGQADETVHHYLHRCRAYNRQRDKLQRALRRGAKCNRTLLASPKAMPALFKYIHDTQRFTRSFGNVLLPDEEDRQKKIG